MLLKKRNDTDSYPLNIETDPDSGSPKGMDPSGYGIQFRSE
jgi:hypothetical protein